jgi:hypothetical protein
VYPITHNVTFSEPPKAIRRVAILEKDMPFPANCASQRTNWVALNVTL